LHERKGLLQIFIWIIEMKKIVLHAGLQRPLSFERRYVDNVFVRVFLYPYLSLGRSKFLAASFAKSGGKKSLSGL